MKHVNKEDRLSWINQLKHNMANETHAEVAEEIRVLINHLCDLWNKPQCKLPIN